jgi:hypothetical protein
MMARASREPAIAECPQFAAQRRLAQRDPELIPDPLHQILQPPAHHAMDGRNRATLHQGNQGLPVAGLELAGIPRRLAIDQAFGPLGVEPHHPVPHRLQPDTTDPRRLGPRAALIDLRQRQQSSALPGVAGRLGHSPKPGRVIVPAKLNTPAHGEPPGRHDGVRCLPA